MTAGLTVINDSGTIQIDENYRNMFVAAQGTNGTPTATGISWPLCAVASTSNTLAYTLTNTSTVTYGVIGGTSGYNWYVMDLKSVASGNAGLQVFNSSGQLVFDAAQKPMRIVDYRVFNSVAEWNNVNFTYPAGRNYAVIVGKYPYRFVSESQNRSECGWEILETAYYGGARVNGNVVSYGWILFSQTLYDCEPRPIDHDRITARLESIVIDVTNF